MAYSQISLANGADMSIDKARKKGPSRMQSGVMTTFEVAKDTAYILILFGVSLIFIAALFYITISDLSNGNATNDWIGIYLPLGATVTLGVLLIWIGLYNFSFISKAKKANEHTVERRLLIARSSNPEYLYWTMADDISEPMQEMEKREGD